MQKLLLISCRMAALLLPGIARHTAQAQEAAPAGGNIVRVDVLAPTAANLDYNYHVYRGFVLPALFSYERRLGLAWSLHTEGLVHGEPTGRRWGATLALRRYARRRGELAGLYLSPTLGFRHALVQETDLRSVYIGYENPPYLVSYGNRLGTGLLLGWQQPLATSARRWVFDFAAGAVYWQRLGADQAREVYQSGLQSPTGTYHNAWLFDARIGIGYQF